jgi:hypothetical protein
MPNTNADKTKVNGVLRSQLLKPCCKGTSFAHAAATYSIANQATPNPRGYRYCTESATRRFHRASTDNTSPQREQASNKVAKGT